VSASVTSVTLAENGWKFFHRVVADDGAQGHGDADYLVKTHGAKTVAVIDDSSTYGAGLANAARATLKTNGGIDTLDEHVNPVGGDFGSTVDKVVAAKPSAVFFGGYYPAAGRLVKQLRSAGYKGAFMSGDGSEDPNFVGDAGGAAEGAFLSCACADTASNANAQAFNSAYRAAFGTPPGLYSAEAYDATNFLLTAVKSGATTPAAINNYLASNNYTGITKTIKFQPDGNLSAGTIYVYEVQKAQILPIGTTS
jgi:branched-chain amino acid transport system substrate-binding protein